MRLDVKLPKVLSLEEIEKLINSATQIRNKAIIALLYSSGMRVGELVSLKPEDIYMSTMQVYISKGKNHRDRWTILSERALDLLKEYWRSYPVKREYLFVSLDAPHEPLKVSGVEIMLRAVGKTAGIEAHPHTLRHSFASHMIEQGVPIHYVQAMKEAFNGANSVIRYLGRYTHRIAISNRRIVSMTDETVTYLVKDYKNGGKYIEQTIKGTEFLRMFLMHVLPKGFVRIRHYGLLSCRNKKEKMAHCRKLLNCIQYISKLRGKTCAEKLMILYKKDICKCEACGGNLLSLSLRGHYMLT